MLLSNAQRFLVQGIFLYIAYNLILRYILVHKIQTLCVRKYVVSHPVAAEGYPQPAYDGLTEIWFDSWADHDAFFTSDNYLQKVQPDEKKFIDFSSVGIMVTEEKTVI